jgi:hypothetical protein
MFTKKSYHKLITCRAIPELSAIDHYKAQALIAVAHKNVPFKSVRNWWIVLVCLMYSLPFLSIIFSHQIEQYLGVSGLVFFLFFLIVAISFQTMCDLFYLRVVRPEILAQLRAQ